MLTLVVVLIAIFTGLPSSLSFLFAYCLLLVVWISIYALMVKEQTHIKLILTESDIRYVRRTRNFVIPWDHIKGVKRYLNKFGKTRRAVVITYSGKYLPLINYADLEEIVKDIEQHAHSLGSLSNIERIKLNRNTNLIALAGILVGFVIFRFFMPVIGFIIMIGSGVLLGWTVSAFSPAYGGSFRRFATIYILLLVIFVCVGIAIIIILNFMAVHSHTHG